MQGTRLILDFVCGVTGRMTSASEGPRGMLPTTLDVATTNQAALRARARAKVILVASCDSFILHTGGGC